MATEAKQEIIITKNGIVRRCISEEPLAGLEDAITRALSDAVVVARDIAKSSDGKPIHCAIGPAHVTVIECLSKLHLTTYYRSNPSLNPPCLTPCFKQEATDNVQLSNPVWTPPEGIHLWFVTYIPKEGSTHCYLVFTRDDRSGIFKLPLPNTYDDGRLCMGGAWDEEVANLRYRGGDTSIGLHTLAVERFMASSWNADLWRNRDGTDAMVRFDYEGKQLPPLNGWLDWTNAVSSTVYNWLIESR